MVVTTCSWKWRGEKDQIYVFHVIDMEFLERTAFRTDKGSTDDVICGVLEPLGEISRKRIVICNDNDPMVKKPDQAVALHREDDMIVKEPSQSIGRNEHKNFLDGGMTWVLRIEKENRFDNNFLVLHVMYGFSGTASQSLLCWTKWRHNVPEVQGQDLQ